MSFANPIPTNPSPRPSTQPIRQPFLSHRSFEELGLPVPMAVADAAVKPSPPPPRIVAAVLELVPFVFAPMLAPVRVGRLAARPLPYLLYAAVWVLAAASGAKVVATHAWGVGSAPFVFLQALTDAASKVFLCAVILSLALAAVLLCGTCLDYVIALVSGSGSEFVEDALGEFKEDLAEEISPRTTFLGWVACMPFGLLILAGSLMGAMMPSPVEGSISTGEMIGSLMLDFGVFGASAISFFVFIPALALDTWREDRLDREAGLTV